MKNSIAICLIKTKINFQNLLVNGLSGVTSWIYSDYSSAIQYKWLTDSIPPKITRISTTPSKMQFKIKDNLSGIKSYRATINNKFLLMRYEPKKNVIWPIPYEPNTPLKGNFALEVMDNVNNKTIYKLKL